MSEQNIRWYVSKFLFCVWLFLMFNSFGFWRIWSINSVTPVPTNYMITLRYRTMPHCRDHAVWTASGGWEAARMWTAAAAAARREHSIRVEQWASAENSQDTCVWPRFELCTYRRNTVSTCWRSTYVLGVAYCVWLRWLSFNVAIFFPHAVYVVRTICRDNWIVCKKFGRKQLWSVCRHHSVFTA
jgi:hypothetical protein